MPVIDDAKQTAQRFSDYVQELINLFKKFNITGSGAPRQLWKASGNSEFRKEWSRIWREIAEYDGGKLTLTTIFGIIGAVFGGVGIAALGGAIGLPLAILLAPVGYLIGSEIDGAGLLRKVRGYLANSNEANSDDANSLSEGEQFVELLSTLIVRCDQSESALKEAQEKISALDATVSQLEQNVSALQSEIANLKQKMKYVLWIGVGICVALVSPLVWHGIKR
jgi:hypothetical protein